MIAKTWTKEAILKLKPYQNGSHSEKLIKQHRKTLKLDSNESTIPPSPRVLTALIQSVQGSPLNWYPDIESSSLCRALSRYTGLPLDHILTFNGSDHALETVARCFLGFGDEAILFMPTYDHFRVYAESCDAVIRGVRENAPGTLTGKIAAAKTPRTKLVYLVNPNNPTGFLHTCQAICDALADHPEILFIVDEAYYEFCGVTAADLVPRFPNLIVTRSFSKAFGLAGLRCGYLLARPELCAQIGKIRVGKNINALAQVAAQAALADLEHMQRYVEEVRAGKEWLLEQCAGLGLEARDTPLNFVLIRVADAPKVAAFLKRHHVYVRDRSALDDLKGCLRVTVGDRFHMKRFWQVFETAPREWLTGARRSRNPGAARHSVSGTVKTSSSSRT